VSGKPINLTKRSGQSILRRPVDKHHGMDADFSVAVMESIRDSLSCQVGEGVYIRRSSDTILQSKSEWHQPALCRLRSEVTRVDTRIFKIGCILSC
jgi:hypothetical protein